MGFEPATFGLDYRCSTDWAWRPNGISVDICGKADNSGTDAMLTHPGQHCFKKTESREIIWKAGNRAKYRISYWALIVLSRIEMMDHMIKIFHFAGVRKRSDPELTSLARFEPFWSKRFRRLICKTVALFHWAIVNACGKNWLCLRLERRDFTRFSFLRRRFTQEHLPKSVSPHSQEKPPVWPC